MPIPSFFGSTGRGSLSAGRFRRKIQQHGPNRGNDFSVFPAYPSMRKDGQLYGTTGRRPHGFTLPGIFSCSSARYSGKAHRRLLLPRPARRSVGCIGRGHPLVYRQHFPIVGLASFFGYKLFKGARSVPFAMVSVIVLSVAAICLAEFAGYVYVYWQAWTELAAEEGVVLSAGELFRLSAGTVFEALADPEYTVEMVGNLAIGLVIAVLGIVTVRRHIFAYANEGQPLYPSAESFVPASVPYDPAAGTSLPDGATGSIPVPISGVSQPMESVPAVPVPVEETVSADGGIPTVPPIPAVPAAVPVGAPSEEPKAE